MAKLIGTGAADEITGTAEDDLIQGVGGDDRLAGGEGDDLIEGGLGDDHLSGGLGDDGLFGGAGTDTASWADGPGRGDGAAYGIWVGLAAGLAEAVTGLSGGGFWQRNGALERDVLDGIEHASGSRYNDFLGGDDADNRLRGLAGADELQGLGGNDELYGDYGDDRVHGGDGDDALFGERGDDRLDGGAGDDALYAGGGGDTLIGGVGADLGFGGTGDDRFQDALDGGEDEAASDRYDGGEGVDTVDYTTSLTGIMARLEEGEGAVRQGGGEIDRLLNVENVTGSDEGDVITGNAGANRLLGLGGDDRLYGRDGDDTLLVGSDASGATNLADGGRGNDVLVGWGDSDDLLFGAQGADRLFGGAQLLSAEADHDVLDVGRDELEDRVRFELGRSLLGATGGGVDRVVAFNQVSDLIEIDLRYADGFGRVAVADAADFLDSDDNGILDVADLEVRESGGDLVLDLDAAWSRAFGASLPAARPQALVLEGLSDLGADRIAAPTLEPWWELVTEPPADVLV